MLEANETTVQKPGPATGPGAPLGNHNRSKGDVHSAKAAVKRFGSRAINKRTAAGRQWKIFRDEFLTEAKDAGVKLTAVERAEVEALATDLFLARGTDAYVLSIPDSIINKRARTLLPVIEQRRALQDAYERRRDRWLRFLAERRQKSKATFFRRSAEHAPVSPPAEKPSPTSTMQPRTSERDSRPVSSFAPDRAVESTKDDAGPKSFVDADGRRWEEVE